jgi:hypothetical protein
MLDAQSESRIRRDIMAKVREWLLTELDNQNRYANGHHAATLISCIQALAEDNPLLMNPRKVQDE